MANKKNKTLSLDEDIYRAFKSEVTLNEGDMSSTVENFMVNYTKASRQLREERIKKTV